MKKFLKKIVVLYLPISWWINRVDASALSTPEMFCLINNSDMSVNTIKNKLSEFISVVDQKQEIYTGLCRTSDDIGFYIPKAVYSSWPKFSGCTIYPVPHPTKDSMSAFETASDKYEGQYGKNRIELAHYVNETFLSAIKKIEDSL